MRLTIRQLVYMVAIAAVLCWHVVSKQCRFLDRQIARLSRHIDLVVREQDQARYFKPHGPDCNCPSCLNDPKFVFGIKVGRQYEAQSRAARDVAIARRRSWWPW
jgi:hypothetical protein